MSTIGSSEYANGAVSRAVERTLDLVGVETAAEAASAAATQVVDNPLAGIIQLADRAAKALMQLAPPAQFLAQVREMQSLAADFEKQREAERAARLSWQLLSQLPVHLCPPAQPPTEVTSERRRRDSRQRWQALSGPARHPLSPNAPPTMTARTLRVA